MGHIYERHGRITLEGRRESFRIHPNYGYDASGNEPSDDLGDFGRRWREGPSPEFLLSDAPDLIDALIELIGGKRDG